MRWIIALVIEAEITFETNCILEIMENYLNRFSVKFNDIVRSR